MIPLLIHYHPALLSGLEVTLTLCAIAWAAGLTGGVAVAFVGARFPGMHRALGGLHTLVTAVPFLILLFWLHYPLQTLLGWVIPPFVTAAIALSGWNVLVVADLILKGLRDMPRDLMDAAITCNLPHRVVYRSVVLPVLFRQLFPALLAAQVTVLHLSLFASLISVDELFRVVQRINSLEYMPVQLYALLALFFGGITLAASCVAAAARKRWTQECA